MTVHFVRVIEEIDSQNVQHRQDPQLDNSTVLNLTPLFLQDTFWPYTDFLNVTKFTPNKCMKPLINISVQHIFPKANWPATPMPPYPKIDKRISVRPSVHSFVHSFVCNAQGTPPGF